MTVVPTENFLWNKQFARPHGKPWSTIISVTIRTLTEHPLAERFDEEKTLYVKVIKSKTGKLEIVDLEGDFLAQATKVKFGKALQENFNRFLAPGEVKNSELLTDSFTINIPLASNATRKYAVEAMKYVLFERCIGALEKTGIPDPSGMTEIPLGKYGNGSLKSKWVSKLFPMTLDLHEKQYKDQPYRHCVFNNPYDGMPTYISEGDFIRLIDHWEKSAVNSSAYRTPSTCQNTETSKYYITKNHAKSGQYVKILYSDFAKNGGQFVFASASQNDTKMCK
ncbi:MAG: hypothetical protein V7776_11745 [Halopseudomonas aestusnigri]